MKEFKYVTLFVVALLSCPFICSCSDDDDESDGPSVGELWKGDLGTAAYENYAVAYVVKNNSEIGSIELTSSGNYIVMPPEVGSSRAIAEQRKGSMFKRNKAETRYVPSWNGYFGTFTVNADGSFLLNNYGTLRDNGDGTLSLTRNGMSIKLTAQKKSAVADNDLNTRLCRTWKLTSAVEYQYTLSGTLVQSYKYTDSELRDEFVQYLLISKAGTFLQVDWDNSFGGYGAWHWTNTSTQTFDYVWLDEDEGEGGTVQVTFDGSNATFYESYQDYGYDDDDDDTLYTYKSEITCTAQ